jgi:signal transduction histidine kinase
MINAALRLKEEAPPGSRSEIYLSLIIEGLERIKHTVRNMLAFSPRRLEPRPSKMAAVIEDAAALIGHRLKELDVRLETSIDPSDLTAVCEPGEIRQVFLNVLINAADAVAARDIAKHPEGRITIEASRDPLERVVVIEVRDNGCGMDENQLHHAFDPFFSTKAAGEGSGLGLSIAHNIITGHGGRIEARSELGEGTLIRIVLPSE